VMYTRLDVPHARICLEGAPEGETGGHLRPDPEWQNPCRDRPEGPLPGMTTGRAGPGGLPPGQGRPSSSVGGLTRKGRRP
jgi:hypothetical protein